MDRLELKDEEPAKFAPESKTDLVGREQVSLQNLPQTFAEWRSDGKGNGHPGVITWPIAVFSLILSGVSCVRGPARFNSGAVSIWLDYANYLFIFWICIRLFARTRTLRHLERVQLEPGDAAVEIAIAKDGVVIGRDIGYIRFEAGYLFFQGTSTTFSFSPRTAIGFQAKQSIDALYLSGLSRKTDRITYLANQSTYELGLSSLRAPDSDVTRSYAGGLRNWMSEKNQFDGIDVFPPNVPSPTTLVEVRNELAAPFFVFTFCAGNWLMNMGVTHLDPFIGALLWLQLWPFLAFTVLPSIRIYRRVQLAKKLSRLK